MKLNKTSKIFLFLLFYTVSQPVTSQSIQENWNKLLADQLELHGHRNWILIVDAAYPYQSNPAIKTVNTGSEHIDVVKKVLDQINAAPHIFPEVYLDKELEYVPEKEAPGIENYRKQLQSLLKAEKVEKVLHEEMITLIDEAAKTFHILVLKTNFNLPYTSVFLNLNCGYWSPEQERKLRNLMPD